MPSLPKDAQLSFFEELYVAQDAEAHHITDGVFLGSAAAAVDGKAMQKRKISHILICHPTLKENFSKHFKYCRVPVPDDPAANILELLPDALSFLGKARSKGGKVFVHCAKGISRSSAVVIALLMLEKKMGFEEAWKACEEKRPIVYPNVGFQIQLRRLESMLAGLGDCSFDERLKRLRDLVPRGRLDLPGSPLQIKAAIGDSVGKGLDELAVLAEKTLVQPQLLQKREQWKRHGLYFENLHKYKALPEDLGLLARAREVAEKLANLPKVFSETLKGVKLATAVANEVSSWVKVVEPLMRGVVGVVSGLEQYEDSDDDEDLAKAKKRRDGAQEAKENEAKKEVPDVVPEKKRQRRKSESSDSSDDEKKKKKKKKKEKKEKKERKLEKKIAKMEKEALKAECVAEASLQEADLAAERAKAAEAAAAELDASNSDKGDASSDD